MNKWRKGVVVGALAFWLAAFAITAPAAKQPPGELVKNTSEAVLDTLQKNKQAIQGDPQKVYSLVRDLVLPHFDFELMSRFVLAQAWRDASASQRERFTDAFRKLLIRTYGRSLAEYSGQEMNYEAVNRSSDSARVTVPTSVVQPDGPSIPVNYKLHETDAGWKVFDVSVEGVSLVQNYRSQFASKVRRDGLEALIKDVAEQSGDVGE